MPNLFGVDIAAIVHQNLSAGLLPCTLSKKIVQARTTGALTGGTNPTTDDYVGRGIIENYKDYAIANTLVQAGDRKITLIAGSIPKTVVPVAGDLVEIEATGYIIVKVERDPAGATYTMQARKQ